VDALEADPRGLYGGGVGYYSWTGDADFAIVIRTATVERATNSSGVGFGVESGDETGEMAGGARDVITVRAGAGIVADSDPASEYEETEQKMQGVLDALDRIAEPGDSTADESAASGEHAASEVSR
jgi:anthranilate synthase component 1